jgi:hypothetical protein
LKTRRNKLTQKHLIVRIFVRAAPGLSPQRPRRFDPPLPGGQEFDPLFTSQITPSNSVCSPLGFKSQCASKDRVSWFGGWLRGLVRDSGPRKGRSRLLGSPRRPRRIKPPTGKRDHESFTNPSLQVRVASSFLRCGVAELRRLSANFWALERGFLVPPLATFTQY